MITSPARFLSTPFLDSIMCITELTFATRAGSAMDLICPGGGINCNNMPFVSALLFPKCCSKAPAFCLQASYCYAFLDPGFRIVDFQRRARATLACAARAEWQILFDNGSLKLNLLSLCGVEEALQRKRKPAHDMGEVRAIQKQRIFQKGAKKKNEPPHARHDEPAYCP